MGFFRESTFSKASYWNDWQVGGNEHFRTDDLGRTFADLRRQTYTIWYSGETTLSLPDQTGRMNTHCHCTDQTG